MQEYIPLILIVIGLVVVGTLIIINKKSRKNKAVVKSTPQEVAVVEDVAVAEDIVVAKNVAVVEDVALSGVIAVVEDKVVNKSTNVLEEVIAAKIEKDVGATEKVVMVLEGVLEKKYAKVDSTAVVKAFDIKETSTGVIEVGVKIRGLTGLVRDGIEKELPNGKVVVFFKKPM